MQATQTLWLRDALSPFCHEKRITLLTVGQFMECHNDDFRLKTHVREHPLPVSKQGRCPTCDDSRIYNWAASWERTMQVTLRSLQAIVEMDYYTHRTTELYVRVKEESEHCYDDQFIEVELY